MIKESEALSIINRYLIQEATTLGIEHLPINEDMLRQDKKLRDALIDFLGDIYVYTGLDEEYRDNPYGEEIQRVIQFLAYCNGRSPS